MKKFTKEQIDRACSIDLVDLLRKLGEELKKEGRVYRWMRYDSTVVYENKWFRHSRGVGGGPIKFMQHFYNMSFVESVSYLLNGEKGATFIETKPKIRDKCFPDMPDLSKNMHRTFAYLIQTRHIDGEVVQHFVHEKKIQETEEHHNIAFCGYDENGTVRQIHLRSTIPGNRFFLDVDGSDKQYCFRHEGTSDIVFVFEAPIDMLSFITMHKQDWQQYSYVCLDGVAIDALANILQNNSALKKVLVCTDNDEAGDKTAERIGNYLAEKEIWWNRLIPEHKDWNEDLINNMDYEIQNREDVVM